MGFIAGSKKIKKAVYRNKAKRRLRALFIDYQDKLKSGLYVFVAKESIVDGKFEKIKQDFINSINRANGFK